MQRGDQYKGQAMRQELGRELGRTDGQFARRIMATRIASIGGLVLSFAMGAASLGQVNTYLRTETVARTNGTSPAGAFRFASGDTISSATPCINDARSVAIRFSYFVPAQDDSDVGVLVANASSGSKVVTGSNFGLIGDPWINNAGAVAYSRSLVNQGVWRVVPPAAPAALSTLPTGYSSWDSAQINDSGIVGYRAAISPLQQILTINPAVGGLDPQVHVSNFTADVNSPYTFLFSPHLNNSRQIACGVSTIFPPASPTMTEVRIFNADGSSTLIAQTQAVNPASPYLALQSPLWLTDNGFVAFIAVVQNSPTRNAVFLSNGTVTREIARDQTNGIGSIEIFRPSANESGVVAFRSTNAFGQRAIWVGDGTNLRALRTAGDEVTIDVASPVDGPILVAPPANQLSNPVFGGNVTINKFGDVAYAATLRATQIISPSTLPRTYGTAVFVAVACRADFDRSGTVDVADIFFFLGSWFGQSPLADTDLDGTIGVPDIFAYLALWFAGC